MKTQLLFFILCINLNCNTSRTHKVASTEAPANWGFSDQGVFINDNGLMLQGNPLIQTYFDANPMDLSSFKTVYSVPASTDSTVQYEISSAINKSNEQYTILSIWRKIHPDKKADLVFVSKSIKSILPLDELKTRRDEWMKFCNEHTATSLVQELYTPDALYFNHKPLIRGTIDIIKEYSYMNNPNYNLRLDPLHIEPVSDSLIYEIGQGSGSYGGKYILVWKKTSAGKWMIYMDSNI